MRSLAIRSTCGSPACGNEGSFSSSRPQSRHRRAVRWHRSGFVAPAERALRVHDRPRSSCLRRACRGIALGGGAAECTAALRTRGFLRVPQGGARHRRDADGLQVDRRRDARAGRPLRDRAHAPASALREGVIWSGVGGRRERGRLALDCAFDFNTEARRHGGFTENGGDGEPSLPSPNLRDSLRVAMGELTPVGRFFWGRAGGPVLT